MKWLFLFLSLALVTPVTCLAQTPAPAENTDARLRVLEEQVRALQTEIAALRARTPEQASAPLPPPSPEPTAPAEAAVPPGATGAGGPTGALPVYGNVAAASKIFNPDIAVIGDFLGAAFKNRSSAAPPSLEMHEAETSFQAIVDPYARADFFLTFGPGGAGVEEGFITFRRSRVDSL